MKRVFLAGTTTGTTWRGELTSRLVKRGIRAEQIINPHLPRGIRYTPEHMQMEYDCKRKPDTIVMIHICPAVIDDTGLDAASAREKRERLGPISMFEIGKFAYSQPGRTGVFLDSESFTEGKRLRKVLEGLANELRKDFRGKQPYFSSWAAVDDWLVSQLCDIPI